ncbi:MAG: hypothetical protein HC898_11010 [Phycisphaerales bacterium]|nr:hypothetical protein [Phycisphaerales bacterium]
MIEIQHNFDDAEKALAKPDYAGAMRNLEAIDKEIRPGIEAAFAKAFDPAFITEYQAALMHASVR